MVIESMEDPQAFCSIENDVKLVLVFWLSERPTPSVVLGLCVSDRYGPFEKKHDNDFVSDTSKRPVIYSLKDS